MSQKFYMKISSMPLSESSSVKTVPLSFVSMSHKVFLFLFESFITHSYLMLCGLPLLHYVNGHSTCLLLGHFPTHICSYMVSTCFKGKNFLFLLSSCHTLFQFLSSLNLFNLTIFTDFLVDFNAIYLK